MTGNKSTGRDESTLAKRLRSLGLDRIFTDRRRSADSQAVLILGMHRSGTSCLAGCLQEAGVDLGKVNEGVPLSSFNPKGNRENNRITKLNDAVLAANGGTWDRPPKSVVWSRRHEVRRERLIRGFPTDRPWGFKDPRTLLTLSGWLESLPAARMVATFRHPVAVARSLRRREQFSMQKGLSLWLTYNRLLLRHHERFEFPLICFDSSVDDYRLALSRILTALRLDLPARGISFFEPRLRRSHPGEETALPEAITRTYRSLAKLATT